MVEYGQGVGHATGAGGGATGGGGTTDVGAAAVDFLTNAVDQVAALPPETLALIVVVILAGLVFLRRAF
jgi:hypothetical protein